MILDIDTIVSNFSYDDSPTRILSDRLVGVWPKRIKYSDSTSLGNPISCGIYNGDVMTEGALYSWEGRNLTRFRHQVNQTTMMDIAYAYDANGLRISKTAGTVDHKYFYDGGNLVHESIGNTSLRFAYDENGLLSSLTYDNGTSSNRYFYVRDILLNIIGLKDVYGYLVVRYNYDAWGNILSVTGSEASTVGQANPFRYKGYYYDTETMMYYCQTRYYVPQWCRWLNADDPNYLQFDSPKGVNLFVYCVNSPITKVDPSGQFVLLSFMIGMGIAALTGALVGAFSYTLSAGISYAISGKWSWSWSQFAGSVIGGAIGGAISAIPGVGIMVSAGITGFTSTAIGMGLQNQFEETEYSFAQVMFVATINGLVSASMAGVSGKLKIPGLNSGRNSYQAISSTISTKFFNGTISRISFNTFSKILTLNMVGSLIGSGVSGIMDVSNANVWMANWFNDMTGF